MVTDLAHALQEILGDRFRLERELPHGGMSRLFLAVEAGLARRVVIKVLPPELASRASVERFQREVDVTAQLLHPHIVPVLSAGGRDDVLFYVTPYVEGETLRQRLARGGPLPPAEAVRVLGEIAEAVAFAHGAGIAHRDLKPDNVFLVDGHAMLADFGVARALAGTWPADLPPSGTATPGRVNTNGVIDGGVSVGVRHTPPGSHAAALTGSNTALGTPGYIPPEGWTQPLRGDVFALAVMGVELLTGTRGLPLGRATTVSGAHRAAESLGLPPEAPPGVAAVLARGLAADPGARYADAREFRDALAGAVGRAPVRGRRAVLLGVVAACVTYAAFWLVPNPKPTFDDHLIAVAPFDAVEPSLRDWRTGMSETLYHNLDGAGPFSTVSPSSFVRHWRGVADNAAAAAVARRTGARWVVMGRLASLPGDSVRIQAWVYDARERRSRFEVERHGAASHVALLPDSVTLGLLARFNEFMPVGAVRGRRQFLGAQSFTAYKEFLRGEQFLRRNEMDSAQAYYERAVTLDSAFALALSRMRIVLRRRGEFAASSLDYALRAGRFNRGLGPRDSLLIGADSLFAAATRLEEYSPAWWHGMARMFAMLDQAVDRDRQDLEASVQLGEATYHFGSNLGRTFESALASFTRAVRIDPGYGPAYYHAVELSLWMRGPAATLPLLDAYLRASPEDEGFRVLRSIVAGAVDARALGQLGVYQRSRVAVLLHHTPGYGDLVYEIYRGIADASADDRAIFGDTTAPARWLVNAAAYAGRPVTDEMLTRAHIEAWPVYATEAALAGEMSPGMQRHTVATWWASGDVRALVVALPWLITAGDTSSIWRIAQRCEAAAPPPGTAVGPCFGEYGGDAARAYLTLARGDTADAVRRLLALPDTLCVTPCAAERLFRVDLLARRGQHATAVALLDRFPPTGRSSRVTAEWLFLRARAADALNDRQTAATLRRLMPSTWARRLEGP